MAMLDMSQQAIFGQYMVSTQKQEGRLQNAGGDNEQTGGKGEGSPATEKVEVARAPCQSGPCCTHLCCITCISNNMCFDVYMG